MGIDNAGAKFLFAARAAGASFRKTATLGRQDFFPDAGVLQRLLDLREPGRSATRFLAESGHYAEKLFEFLGAEEVVAIDNSAYEGAQVVVDMNAPIDLSLKDRFTAVFDGGCLEHVFNFPQAIRNCMELLAVGGHFIGVTPANNFCGHGFYQFSPELFFRVFSQTNGFAIRAILTMEKERWFRVMDPEQFGGRVELLNNRPTYLFVLAEKIKQREIFMELPQQSDYARQWEKGSRGSEGALAGSKAGRSFFRTILPAGLKETLRPYAANLSIRHRYSCYEAINEQGILRGEFSRKAWHQMAPSA